MLLKTCRIASSAGFLFPLTKNGVWRNWQTLKIDEKRLDGKKVQIHKLHKYPILYTSIEICENHKSYPRKEWQLTHIKSRAGSNPATPTNY